MAIDITKKGFLKELNFNTLIEDAAERNDSAALAWLLEQNAITQTKTSKKGKSYTVGASFLLVRNQYLADYLGWKPEKETKAAEPTFAEKQAAREKAIKDAIAKAAAAAVAANNAKKK